MSQTTQLASIVIADDGPVNGVDLRHVWSLNLVVNGVLHPLMWTTTASADPDAPAEHFARQLRTALGA